MRAVLLALVLILALPGTAQAAWYDFAGDGLAWAGQRVGDAAGWVGGTMEATDQWLLDTTEGSTIGDVYRGGRRTARGGAERVGDAAAFAWDTTLAPLEGGYEAGRYLVAGPRGEAPTMEETVETVLVGNRGGDQCFGCSLFGTLSVLGRHYGATMFHIISFHALHLLFILGLITVHFYVARAMLNPQEAQQFYVKLGGLVVRIAIVSAILWVSYFGAVSSTGPASFTRGEDPWGYAWIFVTLQEQGLVLAQWVLRVANETNAALFGVAVPPLDQVHPRLDWRFAGVIGEANISDHVDDLARDYMRLWWYIEATVWPVVSYALDRCISVDPTRIALWGFMVLAPYTFVLGIAGAFIVQFIFYVLAIATMFPILLAMSSMDFAKQWLWSSLKLVTQGLLTLVMAAIAMGFTGHTIALGLSQFVVHHEHVIRESGGARIMDLIPVLSVAVDANTPGFVLLSLIGFISVLLHLISPKVAAKIVGEVDTALTAGAVVGAGQMLGAKALGFAGQGGRRAAGVIGGGTGLLAGRALGGVQDGAGSRLRAAGQSLAERFRGAGG